MSGRRNRNQAEKERRYLANEMTWHAAMRLAYDGPLSDLLSIDQRPHDGLSVIKRKPFRVFGDLWSRKGDLHVLTAPALMASELDGNITFDQAVERGLDADSIKKMLGRDSLHLLKHKGKRLLRGYDQRNIRDAAARLSEGPCPSPEFVRILNGKR